MSWYAAQTEERRARYKAEQNAAQRRRREAKEAAGLCLGCGHGPPTTRDGKRLKHCEDCLFADKVTPRPSRQRGGQGTPTAPAQGT